MISRFILLRLVTLKMLLKTTRRPPGPFEFKFPYSFLLESLNFSETVFQNLRFSVARHSQKNGRFWNRRVCHSVRGGVEEGFLPWYY